MFEQQVSCCCCCQVICCMQIKSSSELFNNQQSVVLMQLQMEQSRLKRDEQNRRLTTSQSKQQQGDINDPYFQSLTHPKKATRYFLLVIVMVLLITINTLLWVRYLANRQTPKSSPRQIQLRYSRKKAKDHLIQPPRIQPQVESVRYYPYQPLRKLKSSAVQCQEENFKSSPTKQTYQTSNHYIISKLPYAGLTIIQNQGSPTISQHYPYLVESLQKKPLKHSIYIHSAPPYVIVLIGAASKSISITINFNYPNKYQLLTAFVLNNMEHKLYFQQQIDKSINRDRAEVLVTSSVEFAEAYMPWKSVMLISDGSVKIPKNRGFLKMVPSTQCKDLPMTIVKQDTFENGIYLSQQKMGSYYYSFLDKNE